MGRDALVEFTDVAICANKMLAEGKKPSARKVQIVLGGIGSASTVQRHFKQWEADQALHLPAFNGEILGPDINRAINLVISTKVSETTATLTEKLAEEDAICLQIRKEHEQLVADYKSQAVILTDLESQYANLTGRAELLESDNKRTEASLSYERKAAESARAELAIVNYKLERLSQLEAEVDMLRSELKLANDKATDFSKAAAVAEAKLSAATQYRK